MDEATRDWIPYPDASNAPLYPGNNSSCDNAHTKSSATLRIVEFNGQLNAAELNESLAYSINNPDPNGMTGFITCIPVSVSNS